MSGSKTRAAVGISRMASAAGRLFGRSGTSFPGRVLLALDPHAIGHLASDLRRGSVVVSATNGKTTTASLIAGVFDLEGIPTVHNSAGANMSGGIAAALSSGTRGRPTDAIGLFEVDEFWLDGICDELKPSLVLLGNLFRDQLDRYGEMDTIASRWRDAAIKLSERGTRLIMCADDPIIASVGEGIEGVEWYGINDTSHDLGSLPHAADSVACRRCGASLSYSAVLLGHLGHWRCPDCGLGRPDLAFEARQVTFNGARGSTVVAFDGHNETEISVPLPGLYNAYNALAAFAVSRTLGIAGSQVAESVSRAKPAFGRAETVTVGATDITMMLIKNPTGANEVIRALTEEPSPIELAVLLNDRIADGRDISWIWDADFEDLAGKVSKMHVGGTRANEMALRLVYAGFDREVIKLIDGADRLLDGRSGGSQTRLWVLPTYTAMLEFREILESKGHAEAVK